MNDRDEYGVRVRRDGLGDGWAQGHRLLGKTFNMQDLDALFGFVAFGVNGAERLFLEYQPDHFTNANRMIRRFAAVAMFDRKSSVQAAFNSTVSTANYLWQCRCFARQQPLKPKFFYVVGGQEPPWEMIELDIDTGDHLGQKVIQSNRKEDWLAVWDHLGLADLRENLRAWVQW